MVASPPTVASAPEAIDTEIVRPDTDPDTDASGDPDPEGVRFTVADTGSGISADDLPHVFDRYWQRRRAGGERGAGLGLAIVRGIVEAHGGHLGVESAPGQGSRFSFMIPIAK